MITFTPPSASVTRRVAVGLSAGAAGADGVPELAQSAHEALMRAPWVESPDAPSMPVHDNGQTSNRSVPSGDAWKCGWGYDATNRTERAAAGAVCYSFALPRAMVAETDAAAVTGLTVRVIGDRYLDAGARVFATLTGSAQPPTLAEMLGAEAASAVVCATSGQTKPDGVTPLAPNNRTGVRADAEITPATPLAAPEGATAAYLHVCLALVDYTTTRGAWIEGGAMLAPDTLRVTFDRDVEDDAAATDFSAFMPILFPQEQTGGKICRKWKFTTAWIRSDSLAPGPLTDSLNAAMLRGYLQQARTFWTEDNSDGEWTNGLKVDFGYGSYYASGNLEVECLSCIFLMAYPGLSGKTIRFQSPANAYSAGSFNLFAFARSSPTDFLSANDTSILRGDDPSLIGSRLVLFSNPGGAAGDISFTFSKDAPDGYVQFVASPIEGTAHSTYGSSCGLYHQFAQIIS